jgi:hypothetical protein
MSKIPKIDTALRDFEDQLEAHPDPAKLYQLLDKLRSDIESALGEFTVVIDGQFVEGPLGGNDPETQ